jgi:hypothetical protein
MTDELENDADDVSLEDALERLLDAREEELHTALPGRIESYDAAAQVADVTPLIRRAVPRADGGTLAEPMPTIRAVPVVWPRAGDWFLHMPLAPGDTVLLVCCERDLARWRQTGELSDPVDRRAHHLAHAVAIPGVYPRTEPLNDTPIDKLVIGKQFSGIGEPAIPVLTVRIGPFDIKLGTESASDFVALASLVAAELAKIQTTLGTGSAPVGGGTVTFGTPYVPASVAATKVKAL